MTFAPELKDSLSDRTIRVPIELSRGQSLEEVLSGHLLAVESTADTVLLTSILLLDGDGKRLWHAAAPSLPQSYCEAINGSEIGPTAGSCGTAAFKGHAIYVTDIATDPLWSDYRHFALPHGLRACWSTPIRDEEGVLVGTFAIYHLSPRGPTREEVEAISMITDHVAETIQWFREAQDLASPDDEAVTRTAISLGFKDNGAGNPGANEVRDLFKSIETDFAKLASTIERAIEAFPEADRDALMRARRAAARGAALARKNIGPS